MEIVIVNSHGSETRIQCYKPEDRVYSQFHHSRVGTKNDFEDYSPYFLVCTQGYHVEGNNHDERWDPNLDSVVMDYIDSLLVKDVKSKVSTFYYRYDTDRKEFVEDTTQRNEYKTDWIPLKRNPDVFFASRVVRDNNDNFIRVRYDHFEDIFKNYLDTSVSFAYESFENDMGGNTRYFDLSNFFSGTLLENITIVGRESINNIFLFNLTGTCKNAHVKTFVFDKHTSVSVSPFLNHNRIYRADEAFMNSDIQSDYNLFPLSRTIDINGTNPDGTGYTLTRDTSAVREFYGCKSLTQCNADCLFESQYENSGVTRITGRIKMREQDKRVFYSTPVSGTVHIGVEDNPDYPIVSESTFENTLVSNIELDTKTNTLNTIWGVFYKRCFANCTQLSEIQDYINLQTWEAYKVYIENGAFENCVNLKTLGANRLYALNHDASNALFNCYNLIGTVNVNVSPGDNWEKTLSYAGYSQLILSADSTLNLQTKLDNLALGSKIKLIVVYEIEKFKPLLADLNGNWLDWQAVFYKLAGVSNVAEQNERFNAGYGLYHVNNEGRVFTWRPDNQYENDIGAYSDYQSTFVNYYVFKAAIGR